MLDARKSAILRKVVTEHIETAQPVGSSHVVQDPAIDVSPATVRSDMAALEREGYLTHPHTSAGRIPTDKGYRFFVDNLSDAPLLDPASHEQVATFFDRAHGELERMLRDTSRLLSQLTDHAAVVVAPAHEVLTVRSSMLTRLGPRVVLHVAVLSNGSVEKHSVEMEERTTDSEVAAASALLADQLCGHTLGRAAAPARTGNGPVDVLLGALHAQIVDGARPAPETEEVYVGGAARMAQQFAAVDQVREVLSILEQSFVVVSLLHDVLSTGQSVAIGTENRVESLAECSLVVAPYEVDDEVVGTIGVLGPTRMNYPQALAAVAVVSQRLGRQLSSG
ncbi:MAG TPA: heat-inducible transcriptional repressor HrcA [Acidimicrobiales bacterium]|nr:heat-inducible transcriptional repressor HrcA [Acidimicrobiales bacterium]